MPKRRSDENSSNQMVPPRPKVSAGPAEAAGASSVPTVSPTASAPEPVLNNTSAFFAPLPPYGMWQPLVDEAERRLSNYSATRASESLDNDREYRMLRGNCEQIKEDIEHVQAPANAGWYDGDPIYDKLAKMLRDFKYRQEPIVTAGEEDAGDERSASHDVPRSSSPCSYHW